MRWLFGSTTLVLLGLSPWILPSIAAAALKMTRDEARSACRSELAQNRAGERADARGDGRSRHWQAMQDCVDAKLSDSKWPRQ